MECKQNGFKVISNKDQSVGLFKNPFLERLTRTHPRDILCFYIPIILYFCYLGILNEKIMLFALEFLIGLFLWTMIEYVMHRFFFHYQAVSKIGKKIFFLIHEVHHAYPRDKTRLVMPPVLSLPFAAIFGFIYYLIFGKYFAALFAGTLLGYVLYDMLHYAAHQFNPKQPIFRYLKRYHLHHHYHESDRCFSVSIPLWDYVIRTQPLKSIQRKMQKAVSD